MLPSTSSRMCFRQCGPYIPVGPSKKKRGSVPMGSNRCQIFPLTRSFSWLCSCLTILGDLVPVNECSNPKSRAPGARAPARSLQRSKVLVPPPHRALLSFSHRRAPTLSNTFKHGPINVLMTCLRHRDKSNSGTQATLIVSVLRKPLARPKNALKMR